MCKETPGYSCKPCFGLASNTYAPVEELGRQFQLVDAEPVRNDFVAEEAACKCKSWLSSRTDVSVVGNDELVDAPADLWR